MSGGTIPDNKYKSSTYVGLIHPVIARHALFSSGSNMSAAYVDLAHTGAAYFAIDSFQWYVNISPRPHAHYTTIESLQFINEVVHKSK